MNPLTKIRMTNNLSRSEFSLKTQLAYGTVSSIEQGNPLQLSHDVASVIAKAFDVSEEDLIMKYSKWRASYRMPL